MLLLHYTSDHIIHRTTFTWLLIRAAASSNSVFGGATKKINRRTARKINRRTARKQSKRSSETTPTKTHAKYLHKHKRTSLVMRIGRVREGKRREGSWSANYQRNRLPSRVISESGCHNDRNLQIPFRGYKYVLSEPGSTAMFNYVQFQ